jgi:predicted nucleic acid-binding protein
MHDFRASHGLTIGDAMIAATSVLNGAALITFNARHYPMPDIAFHRLQRSPQP